ncbi:MAG: hypothetical protein JRG95_06620 [Deltaproteobacteria bacterium]|nr:hypothetical protein [Deltaproteobacteria bacterium]
MLHAPEIEAAWARLREAGRALAARSQEDNLEVLARLLDELALPGSETHQRLAADLPEATGFHPATVRAGLELALAGWTGEALHTLVQTELGPDASRRARGFDTTAVLLGGALPMPTILSLVAPLVVGSLVLARSGRHDSVTARCIADALNRLDPELGACLSLSRFARDEREALDAFLRAECVVATGSDETLAEIAGRIDPGTRFVGYGHRLSVAVIGAEADPAEAADALALDVALWDQLGCLSPIAAWVLTPNGKIPDALEAELVRAFGELGKRLPRGVISPEAGAALAQERDGAELRAASNERVRLHAGEGWTLVIEPSSPTGPAPLHRFLRVHPVPDLAALHSNLAPFAPRLAAVGLAAGAEERARLVAALRTLAPSRIAPLGRMQAPPLSWHHDGQGVLWPLVRFTDVEL